jgi:hypothetical protein
MLPGFDKVMVLRCYSINLEFWGYEELDSY